MSKKIKFDKRSECSAYVTVNGKTIYIEDSSATEGLFIHAWREGEAGSGLLDEDIKLYENDGICTESK